MNQNKKIERGPNVSIGTIIPYVSLIGSVVAIVTAILKESRYRKKEKQERTATEQQQKQQNDDRWRKNDEALKCLLRNDILEIYEHYKKEKRITKYAFDNVGLMYNQYKNRHGNTFVDTIFEQMKTWEIYDE